MATPEELEKRADNAASLQIAEEVARLAARATPEKEGA